MEGREAVGYVDHRNGITDDNRWDNLREVTPQQSAQNRVTTNISWVERRNRWVGRITIKGKRTELCACTGKDEAIAIVEAKKQELYGEYYRDICT